MVVDSEVLGVVLAIIVVVGVVIADVDVLLVIAVVGVVIADIGAGFKGTRTWMAAPAWPFM